MSKFKIIHWDDDVDIKTDISIILNRVFGEENIDYKFTDSPIDDLIERLIVNNEPFNLLILDILDKEKKPVGIKLLKQLKPEHKVIVLTQDADKEIQTKLKDPLIQVLFQKLYKSDTIFHPFKNFIPEIERITSLKRLQLIPIKLTWDKNDINTNYQISIISEEHLSNLISEYLSNKKFPYSGIKEEVRVYPLINGYSGALVFHIELYFKIGGTVSILLKADKIISNIEQELKSATGQYYKQIHQDYRVEYDDHLLKSDIQGYIWYALTGSFIENGETLKRRFLAEDFTFESLVILFKKCLVPMYLNNVKELKASDLFYPINDLLSIFNVKKKAYLQNTVQELSIISDEISKENINDIINFAYTIQEKALKSKEITEYRKIVLVHGDLHGNNIMLSSNDQLRIIDPANMNYSHWSRDICMLIIDLFAYGIDYGNIGYYGIEKIKIWRELGNCLFSRHKITGECDKEPIKTLYDLTNPKTIKGKLGFGTMFELWEFQLSLVIEFLRISYKSNQLPPGKRAACLLIAIDGLNYVKTSLKEFKNNNKCKE